MGRKHTGEARERRRITLSLDVTRPNDRFVYTFLKAQAATHSMSDILVDAIMQYALKDVTISDRETNKERQNQPVTDTYKREQQVLISEKPQEPVQVIEPVQEMAVDKEPAVERQSQKQDDDVDMNAIDMLFNVYGN